jgi:hypothetical protein
LLIIIFLPDDNLEERSVEIMLAVPFRYSEIAFHQKTERQIENLGVKTGHLYRTSFALIQALLPPTGLKTYGTLLFGALKQPLKDPIQIDRRGCVVCR